MRRFAFFSLIAAFALAAACAGGSSDELSSEPTAPGATPTPLEEAHSIVFVSDELSIDEYSQRLAELDTRASATSTVLRDQVNNGQLEIESAIVADFENIGDFVRGLYALNPPREMFTNHERRVQSLMAYLVAFQDRRQLLERASEHDEDVCEETERLLANSGITIDLECNLGDW